MTYSIANRRLSILKQEYLEIYNLQLLAISYSLPYVLLIWAMGVFIAAIILYVFTAGVSHRSGIIIAVLDLVFVAALIWVIGFLRWPSAGWISFFSFGGLRKLVTHRRTQMNERVKTESSGVSEAVQIDMGMIRSRKSSLESYGKEAV
ncbi:hypothetical protein M422DRAFT_53019 [Sphaerobolus stellatus SS14]|uniref:Uncharacterized protein n=1 Tax=Sphaerobolus stellatus (strain SS14) TaxID=990650 RepID=A0A0C9USF5_SPHS4|nr:hypothetical protein M422DRAFT_53019 [Sphaerobolus stellatus SS14]